MTHYICSCGWIGQEEELIEVKYWLPYGDRDVLVTERVCPWCRNPANEEAVQCGNCEGYFSEKELDADRLCGYCGEHC